MKQKVIDQNYLRGKENKDELIQFLKDGNHILLSDYTALESTRGEARINLRESIKKIHNFPNQVKILKDTRVIIVETNSDHIHPNKLIDEYSSQRISDIFAMINMDDESVGESEKIANHWFMQRETDAIDEINNLMTYKVKYTKEELLSLRNWDRVQRSLKEKIISFSMEDAVRIWRSHKYAETTGEDLSHAFSFVFRFALAGNLLRLDWIKSAKYSAEHASKVASDLMDATYYVLGTYFDGCLTKDKKSLEITSKMIDCLRLCFEGSNFMGDDK